jgi:hypothetical protein
MATRRPNIKRSKSAPHPNQPPVKFIGPRPGTKIGRPLKISK